MGDEGQQDRLVEGIDYTVDAQGRYVFTAAFLLKRGTCCGSGCRNCPYQEVPNVNRRVPAEEED